MKKFSINAAVDDDAAGSLELLVQLPDQPISIRVGYTKLGCNLIDPHKNLFCYKNHLLSLSSKVRAVI